MKEKLGDGWILRRARASDNERILTFLASREMHSRLGIRFDRGPNFFALTAAQGGYSETWIALKSGVVGALGSLSIRDLCSANQFEPIAYLSDLRVSFSRHLAGRWHAVLRSRLQRLGVKHAYCSVLRDNPFAHRLESPGKYGDAKSFTHLCGYANVTLLAQKWRYRKPALDAGISVRHAQADDVPRLIKFIHDQTKSQLLAPNFDEREWTRRLRTWPGLTINSFLLATRTNGEIVGCVALYDVRALRATVLGAMSFRLSAIRTGFNIFSPLIKRPRIPSAGHGALPEVHLSHVVINERCPEVFGALLHLAYTHAMSLREYAMVTICLFDGDPLWVTIKPYWHVHVALDLYSLCLDETGTPLQLSSGEVPGFEMVMV